MGRRRRRNPIRRRAAQGVALLAVASAVLATTSGTRPVADTGISWFLAGLLAAAVTWAAASAPWWVLAVAAGAVALGAPDVLLLGVAAAAGAAAAVIGARRANLPVARAAIGGAVAQVALRLDIGWFHGASALVAGAVLAFVFVGGVSRRRKEVRRRVYVTSAAAAGVAVLGVAGVGVAGVSSADDLRTASRAARAGLDAVDAGKTTDAAADLVQAADALHAVGDRLAGPWSQVARLLPIASQHRAAAIDIARAGGTASREAAAALTSVDLGALGFQGGRIDVEKVRDLQEPMAATAIAIERLGQAIDSNRSPWLVGPLQDRLDELSIDVAKASEQAAGASAAVDVAPALLGGDGPRRYFVAFTTPAEARGLGGFMGNFAELTVNDGRVELARFGRTLDLNEAGDPENRVITGPPGYLDRYGGYGAGGGPGDPAAADYWSVITMPPDMPTVGAVVSELYPQSGGRPVDGVIAVDPQGIAALLRLTGPVLVPDLGHELSAGNVVDFLLKGQYEDRTNPERVEALESVARAALDRLLSGTIPAPVEAAKVLGPAARQGHLVAWMPKPDEQAVLATAGAAGALPALDGRDGLALVTNNAGGNKLDPYLARTVAYDLTLDPATGAASGTVRVTLENEAPSTGLPSGVIGNYTGDPPGTNRTLLSVYTSLPVTAVTVDGAEVGFESETELGWNVATRQVVLPPGSTTTVELRVEGVLATDAPYALVVRPQPLASPESLVIDAVTTDGTTLVNAAARPDETRVFMAG